MPHQLSSPWPCCPGPLASGPPSPRPHLHRHSPQQLVLALLICCVVPHCHDHGPRQSVTRQTTPRPQQATGDRRSHPRAADKAHALTTGQRRNRAFATPGVTPNYAAWRDHADGGTRMSGSPDELLPEHADPPGSAWSDVAHEEKGFSADESFGSRIRQACGGANGVGLRDGSLG